MNFARFGVPLRNLLHNPHLQASALYTVERIVASIGSFILFAALARAYDPATYGKWTFVVSVTQFAAPFLILGLEPVVLREIVKRTDQTGEILGSAAIVIWVMTAAAIALPLSYIWLTHGRDQQIMLTALIVACAYLPNSLLLLELPLKANVRPAQVVAARSTALWLSLGLRLFLVLNGFSIEYIAIGVAAEMAIQAVLLVYFSKREPGLNISWRYSIAGAKSLAIMCFPAMLSGVLAMAFFRINILIVERTSDFTQAGYYGFAFSLAQLALMIPALALAGIYPKLVQMEQKDPSRYRDVVAWLFFVVSLFCYAALIFIILFGADVIGLLFGARYVAAASAVSVLFASVLFTASGAVRANLINIGHSQHYHLWNALLGLAVLTPSSLLLTPHYGAVGAALSAVIATFVSTCGTTLIFPELRPYFRSQLAGLLLLTPLLPRARRR